MENCLRMGLRQIIIRTKNRVIRRQPLGWECCESFVDALEILKAKYEWALADVIPTDRAQFYLSGDWLSTPEICAEARRKLRTEESSPEKKDV